MVNYACPKCKMVLSDEQKSLICQNCNSKFLKKNNIPILLIDKMEPLDSKDISKSNQSWKQTKE